ncbi:MAG: 4Fe-4S dicluster domain-containing protein [Paludibacter sp.]|nr:4Fe-4S dicluster domain-containing protein [Paludibacter sp.]
MKRTIIKIDEVLCNGCEACVSGCHEGALQMIDGKARMVSELYCDGLGACIGDCPVGAITLEEREAEPYDEIAVVQRMLPKGEKIILAHLRHLKDHEEFELLKQGVSWLKQNNIHMDFASVHNAPTPAPKASAVCACPGSNEMSFAPAAAKTTAFRLASTVTSVVTENASQLRQWPVQLHLLNPQAAYFKGADVVLAADCVAFSFADFHNRFLAGNILAIACPKLDSNKESYVEKLKAMIQISAINMLTVIIMEVQCCGGLLGLAQKAVAEAGRKIPVKLIVIGTRGDILKEEWV